MPSTARKHFNEDIARARAIVDHARPLRHRRPATALLRDDILRSAWMASVGAMDAYFCDAYADILARLFRAKNMQATIELTNSVQQIDLPVSAVFAQTNVRENWKWRLAARGLIEKDNVLSMGKIKQLFNPFLRNGHKIFDKSMLEDWILVRRAAQRLVGISATDYRRLAPNAKDSARKLARKKATAYYDSICQRRHDCIHNCDRPKMSLQRISVSSAEKVNTDIKLLVSTCDEHFETEFNHYLRTVGASGVTRNACGY